MSKTLRLISTDSAYNNDKYNLERDYIYIYIFSTFKRHKVSFIEAESGETKNWTQDVVSSISVVNCIASIVFIDANVNGT